MEKKEREIFIQFVDAKPGEDLDDGEASSIASAVCMKSKVALKRF